MTAGELMLVDSDEILRVDGPRRRGLVGWLSLEGNSGFASAPEMTSSWDPLPLKNARMHGAGDIDQHQNDEGWSIVSLSRCGPAKAVAELLERHLPAGWQSAVESSNDALRHKLCWDLLPSAAIVARHGPSSTICLIRDLLGFAPLYYATTDSGVLVSTNLQELRTLLGVRSPNTGKLTELLAFGRPFGGQTVWQGISAVVPGEAVFLCRGQQPWRMDFATPEVLFDDAERQRLGRLPASRVRDEMRQVVESSVSQELEHREIVVQGGGGVDSSVLLALAKQRLGNVHVWTINQHGVGASESHWMRPLLSRLGLESRFADITPNRFVSMFVELLSRTAQPIVGSNFVAGAVMRALAMRQESESTRFLNGELCDTVFGGLGSFHQLSPTRRAARLLSRLPLRSRRWLRRGLSDTGEWAVARMPLLPEPELSNIALGHLARAELVAGAQRITNADSLQQLADRLTWLDLRTVPSALHHGFFERDEMFGGQFAFPFARAEILKFGLNLPYGYKYRHGHTKWLWRSLASDWIGKEVAFRPKSSFDTPIREWLLPAEKLLRRGFVQSVFTMWSSDTLTQACQDADVLWRLVNIEIWGRLHCWNVDAGQLTSQLLPRRTR